MPEESSTQTRRPSLEQPLRQFMESPVLRFSERDRERHQIYALMLLAIIGHYWRGQKARRNGTYMGHNIAAIAVNSHGFVLDFDFNHNELFNSSVEHAEARLLRRLFHLSKSLDVNRLQATPGGLDVSRPVSDQRRDSSNYANLLEDVTIYTSLEPCSQCIGMMSLARVKQVVYLQEDPGQHKISNILYHLARLDRRGARGRTTVPIRANELMLTYGGYHLNYYDRLNGAYQRSIRQGQATSVTAFLRDDEALTIIEEMSRLFFKLLDGNETEDQTPAAEASPAREEPGDDQTAIGLSLKHPEYRPLLRRTGAGEHENGSGRRARLNNRQCLHHAFQFYEYATQHGRRGTFHGA